jgi:protein-disulfide isomerase
MSKSNRERSRAERAAAALVEQRRAESRRRLLIGGGIIAAILLIVGVGVVVQAQRDTTGDEADAPGEPTSSATDTGSTGSTDGTDSGSDGLQVAPVDTYGLGVGDPKAPVKIEIFEDFVCPYCKGFEEASQEELRQAAKDGKAFLVYRPIAFITPYSASSLNAFAVVQDKAGAQTALKFHDLLFDNQPPEDDDPRIDWLVEQAVAAGAKEADIKAGIEGNDFEQWVTNGADAASQRGVTGTPTVFVDGEQVKPPSGEMADFVDLILSELDDAQ